MYLVIGNDGRKFRSLLLRAAGGIILQRTSFFGDILEGGAVFIHDKFGKDAIYLRHNDSDQGI